MRYVRIFYLLLLLTSCNSSKNDFLAILISDFDETKIWNYYVLENQKEYYLGYKYKFEKNKYKIFKGDINEWTS